MIGPCTLSSRGVEYETKGFIFTSQHFVAWPRVEVQFDNGDLVIFDRDERGKKIRLSLRDVDNAFAIELLRNTLS